MEQSHFHSGFITYRNRKIPIIWAGQWAEHVSRNFVEQPKTHPLLHVRIQQLAAKVKEWEKVGDKRLLGKVQDHKTGIWFLVVVDVYPKFASIVSCYKTEVPNG